MSFLPSDQLSELMSFARLADREARSDLARKFIRDENDYTSNFTGALRRIINSNSRTGLSATSFLLQPADEREIGADAAIILSRGSESKVAVFEAKWPRFSQAGYRWDYEQTSSGLSHFSDQLERQKLWKAQCAVFEMFYCEFPFGKQLPFLDGSGSSCVWHDDADKFRAGRSRPDDVWTQRELEKLISLSPITIAEVMREFGVCNRGKPLQMIDPEAIFNELRLPPHLLAISSSLEHVPIRDQE